MRVLRELGDAVYTFTSILSPDQWSRFCVTVPYMAMF